MAAAIDVLRELNNPNSVSTMIVTAKTVDSMPTVGKSLAMVDTILTVHGVQLGKKTD